MKLAVIVTVALLICAACEPQAPPPPPPRDLSLDLKRSGLVRELADTIMHMRVIDRMIVESTKERTGIKDNHEQLRHLDREILLQRQLSDDLEHDMRSRAVIRDIDHLQPPPSDAAPIPVRPDLASLPDVAASPWHGDVEKFK